MVQLIELGNVTLLKILSFFLRNPTKKVSYTTLRNTLKIAKASLAKHLKFLLNAEFIKVEIIGLNKIYELNKENVIAKQLKILDNLLILSEVKPVCFKHKIEIYLYGSAARGEDIEGSDIDLLIIGKISKEHIFSDIASISKKIEREIKFNIFSPLEWSKISRRDIAFYERIEKDKIRLC
jgi:predicted nucleotidyltransferase